MHRCLRSALHTLALGKSPADSNERTLRSGRHANFSLLKEQVLGVDACAFERVFEQHFDGVYGYLARRIGPELARDGASETFATAFAVRRKYDASRGEPRAWLFGIAHNLLRRHYREVVPLTMWKGYARSS